MGAPNYVYVASSWRNSFQPAVCKALEAAGIDHYDFRNPPDGAGFGWERVVPTLDAGTGPGWMPTVEDYLTALADPIAEAGFGADMSALTRADATVLILPCGRSAHLELGYAIGQGQRTAIMLDPDEQGRVTPELMYLAADFIAASLFELLGFLGVED